MKKIKMKPRYTHVLFGDVLADYYQSTLDKLNKLPGFSMEIRTLKNRLHKYFNRTEYHDPEPKKESVAVPPKSSFLDRALQSMAVYAASVVEECPSYFQKNQSINSEYCPAFFTNPTMAATNLSQTLLTSPNQLALSPSPGS